jgi:hypothetical protein
MNPALILSREHREALEGRIHQLEAQLAAHVNAPMHGMEGIDESILAATTADFNWQDTPPPISLDTTFPNSLDTSVLDLGGFTQSSMSAVAINQCEHVPHVASPSSPVPSFWSGTTRASSPDMPPTSVPPQFASISPHLLGSKPILSPLEPHTAPSWEFMARMQPGQKNTGTTKSRSHSRNTSNSSISLTGDEQVMSTIPEVEDDLLPFAAAPRLPRQGVFAPSPAPASTRSNYTDRSHAVSTTPLPSRFEAETLTTEFMQHVEAISPHAYGMAPNSFVQLCEMVYPNPQKASFSMPFVSASMARFHVFLAMATGMKLRIKDSPESTNVLLDTCYDLAMQQTSASTFWHEEGGVEAAQLLALFASIRTTPIADPALLQHSFTW